MCATPTIVRPVEPDGDVRRGSNVGGQVEVAALAQNGTTTAVLNNDATKVLRSK